jgi:hypothetical protein
MIWTRNKDESCFVDGDDVIVIVVVVIVDMDVEGWRGSGGMTSIRSDLEVFQDNDDDDDDGGRGKR